MLIDKGFLILIITVALLSPVFGQQVEDEEIYEVNRLINASIGVAGSTASYFGIKKVRDKSIIPEEVVLSLDKNAVNSFDRGALFLNPANRETANTISDVGQYVTFFAPVLL